MPHSLTDLTAQDRRLKYCSTVGFLGIDLEAVSRHCTAQISGKPEEGEQLKKNSALAYHSALKTYEKICEVQDSIGAGL